MERFLSQRADPDTPLGAMHRGRIGRLVAVGRTVLTSPCYGLGVPMEDVPLTLGRSPAERREVSLIDILKVSRQRQPMLPKHVAVQMLLESNHDHSRLNLLDPEGFPGRDFSGLHVGIHDELLLRFTVGSLKRSRLWSAIRTKSACCFSSFCSAVSSSSTSSSVLSSTAGNSGAEAPSPLPASVIT